MLVNKKNDGYRNVLKLIDTVINLKSYLFDDVLDYRVRLYCTLDDLVDQAALASD